MSRIVNGHVRISVEVAAKLGAALDTKPELWLIAQRNVDLFDTREALKDWKPKKVFGAESAS